MIDDKVRIKCPKCSQIFRERARKVRPNFECHCQHCQRLIMFEAGSEDPNIRRALKSAKEIRYALEDAFAEKLRSKPSSEEGDMTYERGDVGRR